LKTEHQKQTEEFEKLKSEHQAKSRDLGDILKSKSDIGKFQNENAQLKKALQENYTELETLRSHHLKGIELKTEKMALDEILKGKHSQIVDAQKAINQLIKDIASEQTGKVQMEAALKADLQVKGHEMEEMKKQLADARTKASELEMHSSELDRAKQNLAKATEVKNSRLQEEKQELQAATEQNRKVLEAVKEQNQKVLKEMASARARDTVIIAELKKKEEDLISEQAGRAAEVGTEHEASQKHLEELENMLRQSQTECEKLERYNRELQDKKLKDMKDKIMLLESSQSQLKKQLCEEKVQASELQAHIRDLDRAKQKLAKAAEANNSRLQEENQELQAVTEQSQKELQDMSNAWTQMKWDKEKLVKEKAALSSEKAELAAEAGKEQQPIRNVWKNSRNRSKR